MSNRDLMRVDAEGLQALAHSCHTHADNITITAAAAPVTGSASQATVVAVTAIHQDVADAVTACAGRLHATSMTVASAAAQYLVVDGENAAQLAEVTS